MRFTCEKPQPYWPIVAEKGTRCRYCYRGIGEGRVCVKGWTGVVFHWRCYPRAIHHGTPFLAEVGYDRELDAWIVFLPDGNHILMPDEGNARRRQRNENDEIVLGWQDAALEAGEPNYNNETWNKYARLDYLRHLLATTCTLRRKGRAPGEVGDPNPE